MESKKRSSVPVTATKQKEADTKGTKKVVRARHGIINFRSDKKRRQAKRHESSAPLTQGRQTKRGGKGCSNEILLTSNNVRLLLRISTGGRAAMQLPNRLASFLRFALKFSLFFRIRGSKFFARIGSSSFWWE